MNRVYWILSIDIDEGVPNVVTSKLQHQPFIVAKGYLLQMSTVIWFLWHFVLIRIQSIKFSVNLSTETGQCYSIVYFTITDQFLTL